MRLEIILGLVGLAIIVVLLLLIIFYPKTVTKQPVVNDGDIGKSCSTITDCVSGLSCDLGYCVIPLGGSCSKNTNSCISGVQCVNGMCGTGINISQLTNIQPLPVIPVVQEPISNIQQLEDNVIADEIILSDMENAAIASQNNQYNQYNQPIQQYNQPIQQCNQPIQQYNQPIQQYNQQYSVQPNGCTTNDIANPYLLNPNVISNTTNPYLLNPITTNPYLLNNTGCGIY
jgi:hypothetical protein